MAKEQLDEREERRQRILSAYKKKTADKSVPDFSNPDYMSKPSDMPALDVSSLFPENKETPSSPLWQTRIAGVKPKHEKPDESKLSSTIEALKVPGQYFDKAKKDFGEGHPVSGALGLVEAGVHTVFSAATVPLGLIDDALRGVGLSDPADALNFVFDLPARGVREGQKLIDAELSDTEFSKQFNKGMEIYLMSKGISPEEQKKIKGKIDEASQLLATVIAFKSGEKLKPKKAKGVTIREDIKPPESTPPKKVKIKESKPLTADPSGVALVNALERKAKASIQSKTRINDKAIADAVGKVKDPEQVKRLEKLYMEAVEHNKKYPRKIEKTKTQQVGDKIELPKDSEKTVSILGKEKENLKVEAPSEKPTKIKSEKSAKEGKLNKPDVLKELSEGYTLNSDKLGNYANDKLPTPDVMAKLKELGLLEEVKDFHKKNFQDNPDVTAKSREFELLARIALKTSEGKKVKIKSKEPPKVTIKSESPKEDILSTIFELQESRKSKDRVGKMEDTRKIKKEVEQLRALGIDAHYKAGKLTIDGKEVRPSEKIPKKEIPNVGLDKGKIQEATNNYEKQIKKTKGDISELIFNRRANTDVANFESSLFVKELKDTKINGEKISKEQLEVIPFIIEGTKVPEKLNRPDLQKINRKELLPATKAVKQHFDKMWKKIVENTDKLSTEQIENYVTHLWDIPKTKKKEVTSWFSTKNRFLNKRYIETLEEGIDKFGLKPKTLDISEIIRVHDAVANSVIENAKFVKELKRLSNYGVDVLMRSDKAPSDWVDLKHPALSTTIYIPGAEGKPPKLIPTSYKVHPDLKAPLQVIFESRSFSNARLEEIARAWEQVDAVLKKTALSVSLFHHGALAETALAKMGLINTSKSLLKETALRGIKEKYRENPILSYPKETKEAMAHGVQFGHTLDIDVRGIQKNLNKFAESTKNIPGLKRVTKLLAKGNEKWDAALWDYLHDPLKLYAFMDAKSKMPKGVNEKTYLRTQGQLINDTFGGQNWDVLMVSPKMQRAMRFFLLSPDWTISTARQALSVTGFGGKTPLGRKIRAKEGAKFWLRAGLYFGTGLNLLNAYFRKEDVEENPDLYPKDMDFMDYTMFGNTIGNKSLLFTGRYEDGTETYLRWGKQFREFQELFMDEDGISFPKPILKKLGGKTAPLLQLSSKVFTGKAPSGFTDWNTRDKQGWDFSLGLMKTIGESALPFSSQNLLRDDKEWYPMDLAMPSKKGMSRYKGIDLFKKAILNSDEAAVKEIYVGAVRNNLDAFKLFGTALQVVKAEASKELLKDVKTIEIVQDKLRETKDPYEIDKLSGRLNQIVQEEASKKLGIARLDEAIIKMIQFEYENLYNELLSKKKGSDEYNEVKKKLDEFKQTEDFKRHFKKEKK